MSRTLRLTLYLFLALLGLFLASAISNPLLGKSIFLLFCLIAACLEYRREDSALFPFFPKHPLSSLLFFPLLFGVTVGVSALTALLFPSLAPSEVPALSYQSLLASALFPAVAEEMLFRFLALSLLLPFGKGRAVLISALLFALFHQSFYQMPYAFGAGAVLGMAALYSDSFGLPFALHLCNNLLSLLLGDRLTLPIALLFILAGAAAGILLLFLYRRESKQECPPTSIRPATLFPLLPYAVYCLTMAILQLFTLS